ncbi:hypothetical protein FACS1894198_5090 [Clostridia bacterium]|nr:hypothetical protein FACS1894198_5090 [Clostridia bacterium]
MINFNMNSICEEKFNYYFFVIGIAKRARDIYNEIGLELSADVKPVGIAVQEFIDHKWIITE